MTTKAELRALGNIAVAAFGHATPEFKAWQAFSIAGNDKYYADAALKAARELVPENNSDADGRAFCAAYVDAYVAAFDEAESNYRQAETALEAANRELNRVRETFDEALKLHDAAKREWKISTGHIVL